MFQAKDKTELCSAIHAAVDAGYRLIDTAYLYQTEEGVGEGLQQCIEQGKIRREDIFVTTKVNSSHLEYFFKKLSNDFFTRMELVYTCYLAEIMHRTLINLTADIAPKALRSKRSKGLLEQYLPFSPLKIEQKYS